MRNRPIIVLDPGHGMNDPGAIGHGLKEKSLTLDLGLRISRHLSSYAVVHLTRSDDVTFSAEKFKDLTARAKYANELKADYLLSIHINAGGGSGFESYIYDKTTNPESERIRTSIHQKVAAVFTANGLRDRGCKTANHAVTRQSIMPSVLMEYGFIDHPQDASLLAKESFKEAIAKATAEGIVEAFGLQAVPEMPAKNQKAVESVRDIHKVSSWARENWNIATANGYFDGSRPGASLTREEGAVVLNRLRQNVLKLIADNAAQLKELERRLVMIEALDGGIDHVGNYS